MREARWANRQLRIAWRRLRTFEALGSLCGHKSVTIDF